MSKLMVTPPMDWRTGLVTNCTCGKCNSLESEDDNMSTAIDVWQCITNLDGRGQDRLAWLLKRDKNLRSLVTNVAPKRKRRKAPAVTLAQAMKPRAGLRTNIIQNPRNIEGMAQSLAELDDEEWESMLEAMRRAERLRARPDSSTRKGSLEESTGVASNMLRRATRRMASSA